MLYKGVGVALKKMTEMQWSKNIWNRNVSDRWCNMMVKQ